MLPFSPVLWARFMAAIRKGEYDNLGLSDGDTFILKLCNPES
jgi:hypothetical protein